MVAKSTGSGSMMDLGRRLTSAGLGGQTMTQSLKELLKVAEGVKSSADQNEEQRRSFAYGNTKIENPRITRETVDKEAEELKRA